MDHLHAATGGDCDQFKGRLKDLCLGIGLDGRPNPSRQAVAQFRQQHGITAPVKISAPQPQPPQRKSKACPVDPPGPGTELKRIFASLGVSPNGCGGCTALLAAMNDAGVDNCRKNRETFIRQIKQRAVGQSLISKAKAAGAALFNGLAWQVNWLDPIPGLYDEAVRRASDRDKPEDLSTEIITVVFPLSGRKISERLVGWLKRQTWHCNRIRLRVVATNGGEQIAEHVATEARLMGYDDVEEWSIPIGRPGLPDEDRRDKTTRLEAQAAAAELYEAIRQRIDTPYTLIIEDDILPPDDCLSRLAAGMTRRAAGVSGVYWSPNSPAYIAWDHDRDTFKAMRSGIECVGGSGFGCLLVRSEVLKAGPITPHGRNGNFDEAFCDWAVEHDWQMKLNWDVVCDHRGMRADEPWTPRFMYTPPARVNLPPVPQVAIIIAGRNNAEYLREAIESALTQTIPCEVVYADDCSYDYSLDVANSYVYRGLKVLPSAVHRGVCDARNRGSNATAAPYLMNLDSDDALMPDYAEKSIAAMKYNTPFAYSTACCVGMSSGFCKCPEWSQADVWEENHVNTSALYARWAFDLAGGWKETPTAWDWDLAMRAMRFGTPVKSSAILLYRRHVAGWSQQDAIVSRMPGLRLRNTLLSVGGIITGNHLPDVWTWLSGVVQAARQVDVRRELVLVDAANGIDVAAEAARYAPHFESIRIVRGDAKRLRAECAGNLVWLPEAGTVPKLQVCRDAVLKLVTGAKPPKRDANMTRRIT